MTTDYLLIALGSHGDVHPFIGIGRWLVARGHRVRLAASEWFGETAERAGLNFASIGTKQEYRDVMNNPDVWHQMRGPKTVLEMIGKSLRQVYDTVRTHATDDTFLVGSSLAMGALCASELHGYRMATAHLAPLCIRSRQTMPVLPGGFNTNLLPRFARDHFWAGADKWFIDPIICPTLNTFRAELKLPPVVRFQQGWWHAPRLTLGLWPEWFFPRQSDYPQQVRLAGFVQYDEGDHLSLDPELVAWLAAGDKPIAFTPGSAMMFGHRFFQTAADACVRLGCRGILLTRQGEQIPKNLPPTVRHVPFAPFGQLLPHCAALVYHGGIGTTAQGLKAGVPLLVMPMSHDQFDNAAICKRLGVGDWLSVRKFTPRRVAAKLSKLLDSPDVSRACATAATHARRDDAVKVVCDLLEESSK
jgi:rhamnosyltransferase subunit B